MTAFCSLSDYYDYKRDIKTDSNATILDYPIQARIDRSLEVRLKKGHLRKDLKCLHSSFIVHSPYEHPLSINELEICEFSYGRDYEVLIDPEVIISDENLETHYTKEERFCMFQEDVSLKYFKYYSQKNCELECLADLLTERCGCTPFYFLSNSSVPTCSTQDTPCVKYIKFISKHNFKYYDLRRMCDCLPTCNTIKFNFDIVSKKMQNESLDEVSIVFKFKDTHCTSFRRYQQFTILEFISESGGILGLLAGSSLLTIIELFYFIVVSFLNLLRFLKKKLRSF